MADEGLESEVLTQLMWVMGEARLMKSPDEEVLDLALSKIISLFRESQMKREKEVVKEIAIYIRQLPTDGHDKWYFYHQDLAVDIELKYLKQEVKEDVTET